MKFDEWGGRRTVARALRFCVCLCIVMGGVRLGWAQAPGEEVPTVGDAAVAPTPAPEAAVPPTATPPAETVPATASPATTSTPPPVSAPASPPAAGAAGEVPKLETAGAVTTPEVKPEELVYLNVQDGEIRDIVKQISKATGRNFILDDKLRGRKITILSERAMTKGELYQTFLSALNVAGFTVVEGPGGVYKIVALNEAKNFPIPTHVDTIPITDNFITRLVTLNNVGAAEMMRAVRDMVSRGGAVNVYPQTNTLIITDSGHNIDRLMKIIKELDQEGPQQVMEIIPIHNAAAKDVAAMVNQLFEQLKTEEQRPKPGEPVDIAEVSKLIPDERTNAIVVLASKRALEQVRQIIAKLDRKLEGMQEGRIHVYYLKHAKAKDLASTLSTLTAGAKTAAAAAPAAGGKPATAGQPILAEFEGEIKITADETINALIITATYKDYKSLIDRVISKLDKQRRQVYLEAAIMELRITNELRYGVSGHGGAGGSLLGFGQSFGAVQGLQGSLLAGPGAAPALLGGLISQQTVNINTISATGATQTVSIPAFSAFLDALSSTGDVNIVSTPNLLTLDNEEATIEVQSEEPIPGPQTVTATAVAQITPVTYEKAGLSMKIKPQIGYGDSITLKIEQELSTFGDRDPVLNAPTKVRRKATTNVLCQDGQTIVIGGLMEDQISNNKRKIPILGDIPLLGFFFSQTRKDANKSNLLIFVTPHIVKDSTDFNEILKRKIEERNRFVEHNYGKRQQEVIRSSIRSHREDLLEFKEEGMGAGPRHVGPAKTIVPPGGSPPQASTQPIYLPPAPQGFPLTAPSPIITAPPVVTPASPAPPPAWFPSGKTSAASSTSQPIIEQTVIPPASATSTTSSAGKSQSPAAPSTGTITIPPAPGTRKNGLKLGY